MFMIYPHELLKSLSVHYVVRGTCQPRRSGRSVARSSAFTTASHEIPLSKPASSIFSEIWRIFRWDHFASIPGSSTSYSF